MSTKGSEDSETCFRSKNGATVGAPFAVGGEDADSSCSSSKYPPSSWTKLGVLVADETVGVDDDAGAVRESGSICKR